MKESREMAWRSAERVDIGSNSSQPSGSGSNRGLRRSITMREAEIPARGINPYMFPTKQKSIKVLSQTCSSGCERNWSMWSLIHTKLRNRLACLLYTSPSPRDRQKSRMPSSA